MPVTEIEKTVAFDLRGSWQVKALAEAKGQTAMALESILAHTYEHVVLTMIQVANPHRHEPLLPCIASNPVVAKSGAIVADVIMPNHHVAKDAVIYGSKGKLRDDFRRLADRLRLSDADRIEMFKCVQRWVVADRRLDPNFDPKDPDAKRLH